MRKKICTVASSFDGLKLEVAIFYPETSPKALVCFSHGMAEHKERYFDFIEYLCNNGYACAIHDHRGHGNSVKKPEDLGYFYTTDSNAIVEDLHTVIEYAKTFFVGLEKTYLFSHSMGTLVARCFLKKYDYTIDKLVLCGPPTRNSVVGAGLFLANASKFFGQNRKPNKMLNNIAFSKFNEGFAIPNSWLSVNTENVDAYNKDPLCGYTFTTNGFINLFKLQRDSFVSDDWHPINPSLPIYMIAGSNDPCIASQALFNDLHDFLMYEVGYKDVTAKLYQGKRHEILNEFNNIETYSDVLNFFNA